MAKTEKIKEINASTKNRAGLLAEISSAVAALGVNITAISAYVVGDTAQFRITTSDNAKAVTALKEKGYDVKERNVVKLGLENRVGALKKVSKILADANIDLSYIYGTVSGGADIATIIFSSNNDDEAIKVLG